MTRKEYMSDSSNNFARYYEQFVTKQTIDFVKTRIGIKKLKTSKFEHLNDLYSHSRGGAGGWIWDSAPINTTLARELGEVGERSFPSPATVTCISKAAARMMLEGRC